MVDVHGVHGLQNVDVRSFYGSSVRTAAPDTDPLGDFHLHACGKNLISTLARDCGTSSHPRSLDLPSPCLLPACWYRPFLLSPFLAPPPFPLTWQSHFHVNVDPVRFQLLPAIPHVILPELRPPPYRVEICPRLILWYS
eukprot:751534-Hanusia_phi.AAC.3